MQKYGWHRSVSTLVVYLSLLTCLAGQNKRRKYQHDRNEDDGRPRPEEDPLKDATTLYVGNLYVDGHAAMLNAGPTRVLT